MKEITKYLGLLAILPLLTVALSSTYIGDAEAVVVEKTFTHIKDEVNSFDVGFTIWADDRPSDAGYERNSIALEAGKLLVTSDKASKEVNFMSVRYGSHTSVQLRIAADDPDSITASILEQSTKTSPMSVMISGEDGSWMKLNSIVSEGQNVYKVSYFVHAGNENLPPGEIMITSDTASKVVPVSRVYAGSFTSAIAQIVADDPGSITASFTEQVRIDRLG